MSDDFADFADAPTPTAAAADDFADFADAPKEAQTLRGSAQAAGSGLVSGVADLAGLPADTGRHVADLYKAAAGSTYGALTSKETTPANESAPESGATRTTHGLYHYVDPNTGTDTFSKNPPPAGAHPYTHQTVSIPSFLQVSNEPESLGSESIKGGIRSALGSSAVDTQEQTPLNRVLHAGAEGVPSAALIPEAPVAAAVSGFLGGAANQTVAENGGGPVARTLAGLAAGSIPGAITSGAGALVRGLVRGGSQGQAAMQARLADAAASDTPLTVGQASGSTATQYLEGALSKLPGSGPLKGMPSRQAESLGDNVGRIVDNLSGGNAPSPMAAGTAIEKGIGTNQTPGTALGNMRAAEKAAYAKVDNLVPPDHPVDVSQTLATLDKLAAPTPGAANTTGALISPKIAQMRDNLKADVAANGAGNVLPYSATTALKTELGNNIDWGFAPSDPVANGALKQVHSALKGDIDQGAAAVSPAAQSAVKDARSLYAANQETREALTPIIDRAGGPEAVYQAATNGTKNGATKIGTVMTALKPDQQNMVRATVLDKMGRASGAQDAPFSASTFLTNWTKLDPDAKNALFGASGQAGVLRNGLDKLTNTMGTIRSGTKLQNWSGSGEAVGHAGGAVAAFEGLKALAAGDWHVAAGVGAGFAANNLLSRALVNPKVVNWFAQSTKLPVSALPNAVNQLNKLGQTDPDARDLANYLGNSDAPIARASGGKVDHEALVNRLMNRWKQAKRDTDRTTKPLLGVPDATIVKALDIAQSQI